MAMATYARNSYDEPIGTGGNREDLSDVIWDVSPVETPVLTMCGKNKATGTNHEWLIDTLATAADNKVLEGGDMVAVDIADRSRIGNYTQIMSKNATVSGTQEAVLKAGMKSEMAYQIARRMKEIKRDGEFAIVGQSNAKVAGSTTVAREMGSLAAYLATNTKYAASGSSAITGDGTDVSDYAGTNRALTEAIFESALQSIFTNSGGGESLNCVTTAASKGIISDFTTAATRNIATDDKRMVASIDVYVGDFHTVRIIPDRHCQSGNTFIIDPEYLKVSELRSAHSFDIATVGDAKKKQIVWEWTLEVCNQKAHSLICDLAT